MRQAYHSVRSRKAVSLWDGLDRAPEGRNLKGMMDALRRENSGCFAIKRTGEGYDPITGCAHKSIFKLCLMFRAAALLKVV